MNDLYLQILRVGEHNVYNDLSGLKSYYKSTDLINTIAELLYTKLPPRHIRGKRVLIKPNLVKHSIRTDDELCLRTHDNFIIAALTAILKAGPSDVIIGDAPIQGCNWKKMISKYIVKQINELSSSYGIPVKLKDFRRRIYDISGNSPRSEIRPISDYVIFNLGKNSLLEHVTIPGRSRFRVTNYDPDRMLLAHSPGIHKYCIIKDFFNADIVISLPKIKTHEKTGITGALKNLVGINGDKDFLPHHRIGGTKLGGDCYPGGSLLRYFSELVLDQANRRQGRNSFWYWQKLSSLLWYISKPNPEQNISAGWSGNDTTWRMVLDLNTIAEYGKGDGTLAVEPQRQVISLCDGIIAGQGDGPLYPEPMALGIVSLTNSSINNDRAMACFMGLPVEKIPLLNNNNWRNDCEVTFNGMNTRIEELDKYSIKAIPPKGWVKHFKVD
jgi:uncharacterized protein (DUF362 family)